MKNIKKFLFSAISAALIASNALALVGCNKANTNSGNTTNEIVAYDGSEITVTFYHTMGKNLRDVLDRYIPEFNKIYPNITIDHEYMGDYPALRDQIATELAGGNSPSMAYCYPDHVALYNKSKKVITLDDYIESDALVTKADGTTETMGFTDDQKKDFIQKYYEEGQVYGDGKMYTLPFSKSTEVLYYNKTFFDENGYTPPKTWDEMETLCEKIKKDHPTDIPLGYDSEANWFITMCEQLGTDYTSATGDHFLFNSAKNREFVERFSTWYDKGYVMTEEIFGGFNSDLFTETDPAKQKSYMTIGSSAGASYQCPDLKTRDKVDENGDPVLDQNNNPVQEQYYPFEVGVAMIPQVDPENPQVIQQGPSICLFKKSEQEQAAAWLFAKFLTTCIELQGDFSISNGYTPVIKSVQTEDPTYVDFLSKADGNEFLQATCVKQTLAQMEYYYVSDAFVGSSEARDQVGYLLQACFLKKDIGSKTLAEFVQEKFNETVEELDFKFGW